jgi:phosphohistidine phosphatase
MDLVIWRHAEAVEWQEGCDDLDRALTPRGYKQAIRMSEWLDRQLPESARIFSSPARRCEDTVCRLDRKYKIHNDLLPESNAESILTTLQWPTAKGTVLIVARTNSCPSIGSAKYGLSDQKRFCLVAKKSRTR